MGDGDEVTGVVAHGLLSPVCSIHLAIVTLEQRWDELDADVRIELLARARERTRFVIDQLTDLVRALPADAQAVLDGVST